MLPFFVLLFAMEGTSNALPPPLGSYGADADQVSVSGFSSGGYMAVQVHVAYSETIMGVGVVGGGPYYCAQANVVTAMTACMQSPSLINVELLQQITRDAQLDNTIDPVSNMENDMVYLYSGTKDITVVKGVVKALDTYYSDFVDQSNVKRVFNKPSGHAFITDNYGNGCVTSMGPWINNCSYNQAYEILNHIYGGNLLKPDSSAAGIFYEFDQTQFVDITKGVMNSAGYVYVPSNCNSLNSNCKVHVSLHGCRQGKSFMEDKYALHTGYNEVADLNDIIVIYPQADAAPVWNPNGCWDWWGYTGINYASNLADQMKAIKGMIDRVLSHT